MTRDEMILEKLADWRPVGTAPHALRMTLPDATVELTADRADDMGCRLTELQLVTGPVENCSAAELTERAVKSAERVTGLLEPLKIYEIDAAKSQALLRSGTPTERNGEMHYYELTLTGLHTADLKRYRAGKVAGGRTATPFVLTHEAVAKVVGDLLG